MSDEVRSRTARAAAEAALVRVAHSYGDVPPFVLLGGLVPELLCPNADPPHVGTTDIDVHVDIEVQTVVSSGMRRLESALVDAGFHADAERVWRWITEVDEGARAEIKFELLTDVDTIEANATLVFDGCRNLGAANLRGTRFAATDYVVRMIAADIDGATHKQEINVAGVSGFLMAKCAAAHSRRKAKDWYDIAFVLLNNEIGMPREVAQLVRTTFPDLLDAGGATLISDLQANFADNACQGPDAYASQVGPLGAEEDVVLRTDARLAVQQFCGTLLEDG